MSTQIFVNPFDDERKKQAEEDILAQKKVKIAHDSADISTDSSARGGERCDIKQHLRRRECDTLENCEQRQHMTMHLAIVELRGRCNKIEL